MLRGLVVDRDVKRLGAELGAGAADVARLVPELREHLPNVPPPPSVAAEQARFRFFDSLTEFLRRASATRPLMIVLDDLHWADKPPLLLLQFLAREMRGALVRAVLRWASPREVNSRGFCLGFAPARRCLAMGVAPRSEFAGLLLALGVARRARLRLSLGPAVGRLG